MKYLVIILLSLLFSYARAQRTYSYNLAYYNTEIRAIYEKTPNGEAHFRYGLYKYGQEILPIKYQYEYNEVLRLFVFYSKKEVRVISAITGKEVKRYIAPRKVIIRQAEFRPITSFTLEIMVKTEKSEKSLAVYTSVKGNIYEIPQDKSHMIH